MLFGEGESGKSYTLLGHDYTKRNFSRYPFQDNICEGENELLPLFIKNIYCCENSKNLVIYLSSALIYKEQIYDLLSYSNEKNNLQNLKKFKNYRKLKLKIGIEGKVLISKYD